MLQGLIIWPEFYVSYPRSLGLKLINPRFLSTPSSGRWRRDGKMWSGLCRRNLKHVLLQLRQELLHVDKIPLGFGGLVMDLQKCKSYVSPAHGLAYYPRIINDKIKKAIAIEFLWFMLRISTCSRSPQRLWSWQVSSLHVEYVTFLKKY